MNRHRFLFLVSLLAAFVVLAAFPLAAQDAKELNRLGVTALRSGNYAEAKDYFLKATKLNPTWAEPFYNAALLQKAVNKRDEMKPLLKKALHLEPSNQTYREEYTKFLKEDMRAAKSAGMTEKAAALREEIVTVDPSELGLGADIVDEQVAAGQAEKAKQFALRLLESNKAELPEYRSEGIGRLYYALAKMERTAGNMAKARDYAEKSTRYPLPNPDQGKELLADIKKNQQETVEGYIKLGRSYAEKGEVAKAIGEFENALAIDATNETAQSEIESLKSRAESRDLMADALRLSSQEKWLEARDLLERVVAAQPKHAEARKLLAKATAFETELMKKLGRTDRLPRSTEERASLTENYIMMGTRFFDAGNNQDAKQAFERALAIIALDSKLEKFRPSVNAGMAKIGTIDTRSQTWEKAKEHYKSGEYEECITCLESLPADYEVDLPSFLAYCYWKTGDTEKAKKFASLQLVKQPDNNRAKFVLGNLFIAAGDNAAAYKILKEVKDSDPEYPGIDDVFYKAGAFKWGVLVLPAVAIVILCWIGWIIFHNMPEHNKNAAIKRARAHLNKGLYKECLDELTGVRRLPNLDAYDGMVISRIAAQAYLKTGAYDRAIGECKHLISINTQDAEAHQWLGFAYLGRRMLTPESLPELLNLYKTEQRNIALISLLGQHYTAQKTISADGIEILEKWLELEPTNPEVLKPLGRYYLQKGRADDKSMLVFQRMMEFTKPEPEFLLGVAKLHLRQKQYEESLRLCEQVIRMDVNNEMVHGVLRDCYAKMEKLNELLEIYRAYLSENPYNVAFQKGLTEAMNLAQRTGVKIGPAPAVAVPPDAVSQAGSSAAQTAAAPADGIVCPHCGAANSKADYYCQQCGKSIV
ncbi:MAG TPA: tetratricopeptide repeat protein [Candidatus Ozemobacteraceae bacterium]|nr:tetratricopeptide repeat protein [Candidatus Ozemobacteraceae bacterium]